jgi:hypothetical protein
MTALVLTPFTFASPAIELANQLWRKRVLPVGDVSYNGRMLHFSADYIAQLASAYNAAAYDQLADARNSHTNDPERHRGTVVGMSAEPDGLYVTVKPTDAGHAVLRDNPQLGISARIVENYERSDGKFYPAAVQHVLGTLDPRIPQLGPWQPVEMSNGPGLVIDLSASSWAGEPDPVPAPEFTPGELAALDQALAELDAEQAGATSGYLEDIDTHFSQLQDAEIARQQARELADADDLIRPARTSEDRLARATRRLQDGIYDAPAGFAFTAPPQEAVQLANAETAITGRGPCGQLDDFGRCASRHHAFSCSHSALPDQDQVHRSGVHERSLSNFGRAAALSTPAGPAIRDFADPDISCAIPEHTVELAHQLAGGLGLRSGDAWDDLISPPAQTDVYQAALAELNSEPAPERQREPHPDVSGLARDIGLRR